MTEKVTWMEHEFSVCAMSGNWNDVPGIYIFTGLNQANQWVPLYIGQASSLVERLATHERWQEACKLGATHVHARVVQQQSQRDSLEKLLIQSYKPRLNTQLK